MNPNKQERKDTYRRVIARLLIIALFGALAIYFLPSFMAFFWPFVIAFFIALLFNPLVKKMTAKLNIPRKFVAIIVDIVLLLIILLVVGLLAYYVISEVISLSTNVLSNRGEIMRQLSLLEDNFQWLFEKLPPQLKDVYTELETNLFRWISSTSGTVLNYAVSFTALLPGRAGSFLINFIILVVALYFMLADFDNFKAALRKHLNPEFLGNVIVVKNALAGAIKGYVRALLLLALFATVFMFVCLSFYGQEYALLISLFLGFIDLLPVIGTIAVLTPWGILELILGNTGKGVFLIIIALVFFGIRKIVEPKIVGSQTGLHPLVTLISIFAGLKISGVWGAVLGPVLVMATLSIFKSGIFDAMIRDLKYVFRDIQSLTK
ncbi:sporulation integral membrane protein YtvI [Lachnospiraceae bacterium PF1-21]|uniref:Sporulation integral membrane protein YtvI n=1 Tax=Ohessyouella blattaphilus TaxID=2949333 RepID=A0ABT1EKT3_9FIRM|nr:sporulation integral membrane protein YtvI [Ohessyouella blattaphilus]MCP1111305.1 sporulation integral membrane protein YtvI [Ohessyouella blattaphilus]MCR8564699.1 sporulation integral membrane protein YtvI [Ohessyouella blattaphilus]MDL2250284.1 sporulation integral membrane protein YtvI [Lachnospiraceae bacterium OttesenSCG-928-J05]